MSLRLLVDVGNSTTKWWLERGGAVVGEGRCASSVAALTASLDGQVAGVDHVALASVAAVAEDSAYMAALAATTGADVSLCRTAASGLGLTNSYQEPAMMGVDRWLAMIGAWRPDAGAVCVVDAGTAVTIDLIDATGQHEGGFILPGPRLMQEALTSRAQRIDVPAGQHASVRPGTSTAACVNSGAWLATAGALRDVTRRYPDHRLIVCGGDGQALLSQGFNAEWRPGLVREGLSRWLSSVLGELTAD